MIVKNTFNGKGLSGGVLMIGACLLTHASIAAAPLDGPVVASATPTGQSAAADKPFSKILRESFAHNHEDVGHAAFNTTLFENKLTKAQLEIHLQHRALIHSELHRILINADPEKHVPYGAEQKKCAGAFVY